MDRQDAIGLHLLQPDLGRILPPRRAARDALCLFRECPLRELLQMPHSPPIVSCAAAPRGSRSSKIVEDRECNQSIIAGNVVLLPHDLSIGIVQCWKLPVVIIQIRNTSE